MNNKESYDSYFDEMLKVHLTEQPPDYIVKNVTPFKKPLNRVFTGLAFSALTLNFWCLNYILPFIGIILSILGLRTLRKENKYFFACFVVTVARAVRLFSLLLINSTIYSNTLNSSTAFLPYIDLCLILLFLFFLKGGLQAVQKKAGLEPDTKRMSVLILWYLAVCLLAFMQYTGFILGYAVIIAYIFIIRSLFKLSKEMDETGYAIETVSVKISDPSLTAVIVIIVTVGCILCNIFFGSYSMKWEVYDTSEHGEVQEIKSHLISLGFPSHILEDMSAEDIADCEGALQVVSDVDNHPVNEGRETEYIRETLSGNTSVIRSTVYDAKELCITGIAVQLPEEKDTWKIIHHFRWTINPGFYGTESLQLWTPSGEGYKDSSKVTGRVLYTENDISYTAPYHSLGKETYTSSNIFFGEKTSQDTFATFSFPDNVERQRGYISYEIEEIKDGWIVDSWVNYTHQKTPFQYPVMTAAERRMSDSLNSSGAFYTVQDALQFDIKDGKAELF